MVIFPLTLIDTDPAPGRCVKNAALRSAKSHVTVSGLVSSLLPEPEYTSSGVPPPTTV
jgi:hypothetical protein